MRLRLGLPWLCVLTAIGHAQSTWYVDASATPPGAGTLGSPYKSIQYAIGRPTTVSGDTLLVMPGTYHETINFSSKSISLKSSAGPTSTVIDAGQAGTTVTIGAGESPATLLQGFTITGGDGGGGGSGGGLVTLYTSPTIRDCVIRGNSAIQSGGGVWVGYGSANFDHCIIANNVVTAATGKGGGMHTVYGFTSSFTNCTIAFNSAASAGGLMSEFSTNATMKDCIVWGNTDADLETYVSILAVSYSDIDGGYAGTGNINSDPLFLDSGAGDFHLTASSPCINTGDPASPLDPNGTRADMGALSFGQSGFVTIYCTAGTTTNGCNAFVSAAGVPSASAGSGFTINVSGVEGQKQGIVFYGLTGRIANPWGAGSSFLCVKTPTQRTGTQNSGGTFAVCNGSLSLDWNAYIAGNPTALGNPFQGGQTVDAQGWFRDPAAAKTTSLSNALEFVVYP